VIERSLCLAALVVRGFLESAILLANTAEERAACEDLARRLNSWLNEQDFTATFTRNELDMLGDAPGTWTPEHHEQQSNHVEALGVLLWALSLHETFPGYDDVFPLPDLQPLIGWTSDAIIAATTDKLASFPYNGTDLLSGLVQLRPLSAITTQRAAAECWQWRTRAAELQHRSPAAVQEYALTIGIAAQDAHAAGAIPRPIGNDFPLGNKPFVKATEADQTKCARIAAARRLVLDWLCGYATAWDEILVVNSMAA
jgi:hypothetical protein